MPRVRRRRGVDTEPASLLTRLFYVVIALIGSALAVLAIITPLDLKYQFAFGIFGAVLIADAVDR